MRTVDTFEFEPLVAWCTLMQHYEKDFATIFIFASQLRATLAS
jgi:hypothetical protein